MRTSTSTRAGQTLPIHAGLILQLVDWVAERPRTYRETMEAWGTFCPLMSVWEDATEAGLVAVAPSAGVGTDGVGVRVTARGQALLKRAARTAA